MPMLKAVFMEGEARNLTFQVSYNGAPLDMAGYTVALEVDWNGIPVINKGTSDFDMSVATSGMIQVLLTSDDLSPAGEYRAQLAVKDPSGIIRKSEIFPFEILPSIVWQVFEFQTSCEVISGVSTPELAIS